MKLRLGRKGGSEDRSEPTGSVEKAGSAETAVRAENGLQAGADQTMSVDHTAPAVEPAPPPAASWEPPAPSYATGASSAPAGVGGLFSRMYGAVGEQTAAERERQADQEFRQVLAPAMELLHASVPEASSPEEAARILEQSQGELVPDPKGGAYIRGDAFETDARIYYRLLRRDYEKTPRPSEKRQTSHHLHQAHGKLTGTKGW